VGGRVLNNEGATILAVGKGWGQGGTGNQLRYRAPICSAALAIRGGTKEGLLVASHGLRVIRERPLQKCIVAYVHIAGKISVLSGPFHDPFSSQLHFCARYKRFR